MYVHLNICWDACTAVIVCIACKDSIYVVTRNTESVRAGVYMGITRDDRKFSLNEDGVVIKSKACSGTKAA
eukprot:9421153-Karenia_brevis.AAC.1